VLISAWHGGQCRHGNPGQHPSPPPNPHEYNTQSSSSALCTLASPTLCSTSRPARKLRRQYGTLKQCPVTLTSSSSSSSYFLVQTRLVRLFQVDCFVSLVTRASCKRQRGNRPHNMRLLCGCVSYNTGIIIGGCHLQYRLQLHCRH
jgi:hypothetical protein